VQRIEHAFSRSCAALRARASLHAMAGGALVVAFAIVGLAQGGGARAAPDGRQANVILRLQISGSGTGMVTSSPGGISCSTSCNGTFASGTTVTLTATPTQGSAVYYWSVGEGLKCREVGNSTTLYAGSTCTLTMDRDHGVYVTFKPAPTLRLQIGGSGTGTVTSSPAGISCNASCASTFATGTTVTLTATPTKGSAIYYWALGEGLKCREVGNSLTRYAGKNCTLTLDTDHGAYVVFNPAPTVFVYMSGAGTVTSSPAGIACSESCKGTFPTGTTVRLSARPKPGFSIEGWSSGVCREQGNKLNTYRGLTCAFPLNEDRSVNVSFVQAPKLAPANASADPRAPGPTQGVTASVSGNGTVVGSSIACGARGFRCYGQYPAQQRIVLKAVPAAGSVFQSWNGPCAGQGPTCTLTVGRGQDVSANFAPSQAQPKVAARLDRPRLRVRWQQSVATGTLTLDGFVAKPARLRIEVRRPKGRPLVTTQLSASGTFRYQTKLFSGLAGGQNLFPGGVVIALTGTSGGVPLAPQLRTIVLGAPPEGVVGLAFVSRTEKGPSLRFVSKPAREVWATFVFEAQPRAGQPLAVRWYQPNGKLLGEVKKPPNRLRVTSFLRGRPRLPNGAWRAELRVGPRIVKQLRVQVGCKKC
jgi:hypothetical protein